jgi:phage gpG-like protein
MKPEQAIVEIERRVSRLQNAIARDIPRRVGKIAVDYYHDSFHQQGFLDNGRKSWKPAKRIGTVKSADGKYLTLLSRRKELYNSIHFVPGVAKVNVISNKPYSRIHNYGGVTHPTVTQKMRKFAWAMHYKQAEKGSKEFTFWKGLALTKKQRLTIPIIKRQFMGKAAELNQQIKQDALNYVRKIFKN